RDRTAGEVRDISLVRRVDGVCTSPVIIHNDNWEIKGCPVNGPAIDTFGEQVAVAWFTEARDISSVNIAFSVDAGETFGSAVRIDQGEAAGRVDVLQQSDGSALVSSVTWNDGGETLFICRALPEIGCSETQIITRNDTDGSINFPRMVSVDNDIYITWTQPLNEASIDPELNVTVRVILAQF
ncbi:MAG: sialidase family protein, partial [Paracoccaceae bacterium]